MNRLFPVLYHWIILPQPDLPGWPSVGEDVPSPDWDQMSQGGVVPKGAEESVRVGLGGGGGL